MFYTLESAIVPIKHFKENKIKNKIKNKINIFCQFFIHPNEDRYKELIFCLLKNIENDSIDKIYLLNEYIYSVDELDGINSDKIIQVNINKRLSYSDVFNYIDNNNIDGFFCIINADIFFDKSLNNLHTTNIENEKYIFSQLRFEYDNIYKKSVIYGPTSTSQDTWIFHSNFIKNITKYNKIFDFNLGSLGCDNKILYLLNILGFKIINAPDFIKTYHYHTTQIRNYNNTTKLSNPYCLVNPLNYNSIPHKNRYYQKLDKLSFYDNTILYNYILNKINKQEKFVIPRIAGIENAISVYSKLLYTTKDINIKNILIEKISKLMPFMKNNAGIKISSNKSIIKYSKNYLDIFKNCEIYTGWEKNGSVYRGVKFSQDYIENELCKNKKMIWAFGLDIFHYIYSESPWTFALKGKRILLISAFEESLKKQILIRKNIYGIELFPNCEFILIKPPQTQGTQPSLEFDVELDNFYKKLDIIKDNYDIALVSCGGYGNLVSNYIYINHNKSAIYVGGVLQMYFGILGNRWLTERKEIVDMYFNDYWTRPLDIEKPSDYKNVEDACYW